MIEFLKERKIVVVIIILAVALLSWKIYSSNSGFEELDSNEIMASNTSKEESTEEESEEMIVVHITGEVKKQGVVKTKEGSRIEDIIEAAGGLTENADITDVNLAYTVEDGVKIRIPSNNDETDAKENYISEDAGEKIIISDEETSSKASVVNINNATQEQLEELPGIGPSIASRIVEYRTKNGKFKTVEDIKNVTGIGDSKYEKIKELIKLK